jgi:hypothetical protein
MIGNGNFLKSVSLRLVYEEIEIRIAARTKRKTCMKMKIVINDHFRNPPIVLTTYDKKAFL